MQYRFICFVLLRPKYFLSTLFSNTCTICNSFKARDYTFHMWKIAVNRINGYILFYETKFSPCLFSVFSVNVPESWAENSNRIIQRSQNERSKSAQLRTDSDNLISQSANDIWNAWNATNNALSRRASEILETKAKLQMHLHKVCSKQLNYTPIHPKGIFGLCEKDKDKLLILGFHSG